MIDTEKKLLERDQIAASIGQDIVIEQLKKYRERFVSAMKAVLPTSNDPNGFNLHRALGRIEAIDFLIAEGTNSIITRTNNKKG